MACTTDDAEVWSPEGPTALSDLSIRLSSMLDKLEEEREAVKFSDAERFAEVALPQSDNVHKRPHTEISGTCSALRDVVLIRDKVGNSGNHFLRQRRRQQSKDVWRDEQRNGLLSRAYDLNPSATPTILRKCSCQGCYERSQVEEGCCACSSGTTEVSKTRSK
jgi:hypothetical protein